MAAVRPERLTLADTRPAAGVNALQGEIVDIAYLGQDLNVHLAVEGARACPGPPGCRRGGAQRLATRGAGLVLLGPCLQPYPGRLRTETEQTQKQNSEAWT